MPQQELDHVPDFERKMIADSLLTLYRDMGISAHKDYLPTTKAAYDTDGGFQEERAALQVLLGQPETLQRIVDEFRVFVSAFEENPDILPFRYHWPSRPNTLLQRLTDLQREQIIFTAAEGYDPQRRYFISGDEIDRVLRGTTDFRLGVYSYFLTHTNHDERRKYLKSIHGEYSGSYNGIDNKTWTTKGLSFSHGSITAPYAKVELNWTKIEKRIAAMIDAGTFLDDEDRATIPDYEQEQLARQVYGFFSHAPAVFQRPFPAGTDQFDAYKIIAEQLRDPDSVEQIYQMMLRLRVSTSEDDRDHDLREQVFIDFSAYRDGTFSLFGEHREPKERPEAAPMSHGEEYEAELAHEILHFYGEFDGPNYLESLGAVSFDDAMAKTRQALRTPEGLEQLILVLESFLNEADAQEEIYANIELTVESLRQMDDELSPTMELAKKLINEYCQEEFQSDSDFSDPSNVGVVYTTSEDEAHRIQVSVNLIDWSLDFYVDDKLVHQLL